MNDDSSLARNLTSVATSSGSPRRPSGWALRPMPSRYPSPDLRHRCERHRRADDARAHRVDAYAEGPVLERRIFRQHHDGGLGRVVRREPGAPVRPATDAVFTIEPRSRPGVREHGADRGLHSVVDAVEVDVDHPLVVGQVRARERSVELDAGVVEHDVETTVQRRNGLRDESVDLSRIAHVGPHADGACARATRCGAS